MMFAHAQILQLILWHYKVSLTTEHLLISCNIIMHSSSAWAQGVSYQLLYIALVKLAQY